MRIPTPRLHRTETTPEPPLKINPGLIIYQLRCSSFCLGGTLGEQLRANELETQIWGAEGFNIRLLRDGKDVRGDASGFTSYPFQARLPGSKTVSEWKQGRLSRTYPGYTAEVLDGAKRSVHGNTLLKVVRESYDS